MGYYPPKYYPKYNNSTNIKPWEPPPLIKNKIARNILLTLAITAGVVLVATNPMGAQMLVKGVLRAAFRKSDFNREAKRLQKLGYIALTKTPDGWVVRLLKKGRKRASRAQLASLKLSHPTTWDKKWRLLIFDIPEKEKIARDVLRQKLKDLGMYNFQRSVFAYPYDCREELAFVTDYFGLTEYTTYAEVGYLDIDKELRAYFGFRKSG